MPQPLLDLRLFFRLRRAENATRFQKMDIKLGPHNAATIRPQFFFRLRRAESSTVFKKMDIKLGPRNGAYHSPY